jgi:hypothetical protein
MFKKRESELVNLSTPLKIICFRTSIWDETLYKVGAAVANLPLTLIKGVVLDCILNDSEHQNTGETLAKIL